MRRNFYNFTEIKKNLFLETYEATGNISRSADLSGISCGTHYRWLREDPEYATMFEEAHSRACDALEAEARRRAVEGVEKPVFYRGQIVGCIREYSDRMLELLLKAKKPREFRERVSTEISGPDSGPIEVWNYEQLADTELDRLLAKKLAAFGKDSTPAAD
jgi:hypothetical protein